MNLLYFLLRKSWRLVALSIFIGLVSGLAGAGIVVLINTAMGSSRGSNALAWSFVGFSILFVATKALTEVLLTGLGQETIAELRMHLSQKILAAPLRHIEALGSHRLLASLIDDVKVIADAYVRLPSICVSGAMVIGCLAYLGWLSWLLLFWVVACMAIAAVLFQLQEKKALRWFIQARNTSETLFQHFRSILSGFKELKMHQQRRHAFIESVLQRTVTAYRQEYVAGMTTYSIASSWALLCFYLVIGLVLFVFPGLLELSAQTVSSSVLIVLYLMAPFSQIVELLPLIGRAEVAWKKLEALGLSLAAPELVPHVEKQHNGSLAMKVHGDKILAWKRLELRGVTHRYHRDKDTFRLGPIDLSFEPGELVFLVGGNGSGKTTLAMLLLGLYTPEAGEIRLDSVLIGDSNRESYRQLFSTVFSDFHLFDTLLGIPGNGVDGQARTYLERLQLESKVRVENGALSTQAVSQGQRKRLALLTAYLEDRPFLVFDEWAADQDPMFRKIFYTEILRDLKAKEKTVLVITHDDQYFSVADRCIRMDFGQIVEVSERVAIDG